MMSPSRSSRRRTNPQRQIHQTNKSCCACCADGHWPRRSWAYTRPFWVSPAGTKHRPRQCHLGLSRASRAQRNGRDTDSRFRISAMFIEAVSDPIGLDGGKTHCQVARQDQGSRERTAHGSAVASRFQTLKGVKSPMHNIGPHRSRVSTPPHKWHISERHTWPRRNLLEPDFCMFGEKIRSDRSCANANSTSAYLGLATAPIRATLSTLRNPTEMGVPETQSNACELDATSASRHCSHILLF